MDFAFIRLCLFNERKKVMLVSRENRIKRDKSCFTGSLPNSMTFLLCGCESMHHSSSFTPSQIFDTAEFYMNHAWACAVVLFGIRHLAFRGVVWMHGCFFRHAVQG
jgi:hypothetical protein